jgi:acyl-CoA synthetase (AMP-forming)/AMP-acid ligase II
MKVFDLLVNTAAASPEKMAAIHLERQISYGDLHQASLALATRIKQLDLEPGSRVAILFENSIDYLVCFFGSLGSELVTVPLDSSLTPDGLNAILADCGASVLMVQGKYRRHLKMILGDNLPLKLIICDKPVTFLENGPATERLGDILEAESTESTVTTGSTANDSSLAAIFYTSGSTGEAKGVMLSHRNLISNTQATVKYLDLDGDSSMLIILPFYYIYGNSLLLTHMACGGLIVIDNRFMYPEVVLDTLEESKVTGLAGVPSTFMIALNKSTLAKRKLKHLEYITQAGGAMAPEVTRALMAACPNQKLWIMYGQTEASPRVTYLPPERLQEKLGSIGIPVPGVEVVIRDEVGNEAAVGQTGEIVVRGPNVMLGYWGQPEETSEVIQDGWLITGDLAHKDEDGFIFVDGRKREIIKSAGHRVSAKEIEERILEFDMVAEVAVFGMPDDILGESIQAVVVLKADCQAEANDIQSWCQHHLAAFKVPRAVRFVGSLPKYKTGKVNKLALKEQN